MKVTEKHQDIAQVADLQTALSDRVSFDQLVYTPIEEAVRELELRRQDATLGGEIETLLGNKVPPPFQENPCAFVFRHVGTANYETRRFLGIVDALDGIEPLIFEYYEDKFTSNNEEKHALGRLYFYAGRGKKGGSKIDSLSVIDFNASNGKKISSLRTVWNQSLVDFHHEFFENSYRKMDNLFFDGSDWFAQQGGSAKLYYEPFLALAIRHGILYENFLFDPEGIQFTRDVFLPAFLDIWRKTGRKPLIVNIEPTDIEGDRFWLCHPSTGKELVLRKLAEKESKDT